MELSNLFLSEIVVIKYQQNCQQIEDDQHIQKTAHDEDEIQDKQTKNNFQIISHLLSVLQQQYASKHKAATDHKQDASYAF